MKRPGSPLNTVKPTLPFDPDEKKLDCCHLALGHEARELPSLLGKPTPTTFALALLRADHLVHSCLSALYPNVGPVLIRPPLRAETGLPLGCCS